uniref:Uncharacterized protein n=1 Tax=Anopheles merus TaxID=30066 RepID=A0A182VGM5_ANOME
MTQLFAEGRVPSHAKCVESGHRTPSPPSSGCLIIDKIKQHRTTVGPVQGRGGFGLANVSPSNQIIKAAASNQSAAGAAPPTTDDGDVAAGEQPSDPSVQLRSRELPPNRNNNSPLNQCINELTTNLHSRRCVSELVAASSSSSTATSATTNPINAGEPAHQSTAAGGPAQQSTSNGPQPTANGGTPGHDVAGKEAAGRVRSASQSEAQQPLLASPSHFVTVIEVKESKGNGGSGGNVGGASDKSPQDSETPSAPKTANYENVLINTGARFGGSVENLADLPYQQQQQPHTGGVNASTFLDSKHPKPPDRSSDGGGVGVGGSFTGGGSSISERTSQLLGASAAADHKKKVPPRLDWSEISPDHPGASINSR